MELQPLIGGIEPAQRHAKGHFALRHPAHVGRLKRHAAIVKDHQIDERHEGPELHQIGGLVQVIAAKVVQCRQAGPQGKDRHGHVREGKGRRHLQRRRSTPRGIEYDVCHAGPPNA